MEPLIYPSVVAGAGLLSVAVTGLLYVRSRDATAERRWGRLMIASYVITGAAIMAAIWMFPLGIVHV